MNIRQARETDLKRIARCHISAFPKSLSSALGVRYVTKMLGWYLDTGWTFLFFGEVNDVVVGYCGGMVKDGKRLMGSASGMAQFSFKQAVLSFLARPWLLLHPEVKSKYKFIFRNVWRKLIPGSRSSVQVTAKTSASAESYVALVVIGVNSLEQGKGYGTLLLKEFENRVINLGYKKMLLTVLSTNTQAITTYLKSGWQISVQDPKSTTMIKTL